MKKYGIISAILLTAFLTGCTSTQGGLEITTGPDAVKPEDANIGNEDDGTNNNGVNPWVEVTKEDVENGLGIEVILPPAVEEYDKDVICRYLESEGIYEIEFSDDILFYTYRLKKGNKLEDISGMNYEWTNALEESLLGEGMIYGYYGDDENVQVYNWYDSNDGIIRSLSTSYPDLDGFDITAIAMSMVKGASADYEAAYAEVLDSYATLISEGYDFDKEYRLISTGVLEAVNYGNSENLGYLIEDISGDGVPELIIGENTAYEGQEESAYIYAVYSISGSDIVMPLEGWGRNRYLYLGDGRFENSGSSGAAYSAIGVARLTKDGSELEWEDFWFTSDEGHPGEISYYHNTTGDWDVDKSEQMEIEPEKFWELTDKFDYQLVNFTLFSNR